MTIASSLASSVTSIVDDGLTVTSAQKIGTTGSAHVTPIAPPYSVTVTPSSQTDGAHVGTSVTYPFHVTNLGYNNDTYTLSATSVAFPATVYDAACTTIITSIAVASGATGDVCLSVAVPASAAGGATDTATFTATSTGAPTVSASGTATTIAVTTDTLLVDNDGNGPDVSAYYTAALTAAGKTTYDVWDLATNPVLPLGYMKAHKNIIWFTGNTYPDPLAVHETNLAAFLDGGGRLFLSGQDVLDQGAGTTPFVLNYLHVTWDGSETQNDKATAAVTAEAANTVTGGLGTVPLDLAVLGGVQYSDEITPVGPPLSRSATTRPSPTG